MTLRAPNRVGFRPSEHAPRLSQEDSEVRRELDHFRVGAKLGSSHVFETLSDGRAAFHRDSRRTQS